MKKKITLSILISEIFNLISAPLAHAADPFGKIIPPTSKINSLSSIGSFTSVLVNLLVVGAGLYALIQFLLGGFNYISSSGDPKKASEARQRIYYAAIGLAIIAASFILIRVLSQLFFGSDIITNPVIKTI